MNQIIFIDIETASNHAHFSDLSEKMSDLFIQKHRFQIDAITDIEKLYQDKAGILAEFGKIICICFGIYLPQANMFRIKKISSADEVLILKTFLGYMKKLHDKKFNKFVGHNIKEFDIPFICRRLLIHGLPIPPIMDIQGKKPWEVIHEDTLELWKFGDYKHYVSLDLLTQIFDIDSPKSDISGKDISKIYYETMDLERISAYCAQDIVAVFQVYQKLKQIQIPEYQVEIIA